MHFANDCGQLFLTIMPPKVVASSFWPPKSEVINNLLLDIDSNIIEECKKKISIKKESLNKGISLKQILIDLDLSNSNGESKRLIEQGAVKINQIVVEDKDICLSKENFIAHPKKKESFYSIVFVGKKRYGLIELVS